jgi:hypothetical protein
MSNHLSYAKKIDVLERFLAGASYRTIQRHTGVHPNTIGRLIIKAGHACRKLLYGSWCLIKELPVIDVVKYDVLVNNVGHIVLVAIFDDLVVGCSVGRDVGEATTKLLVLPHLRDVGRLRTNCRAARYSTSNLNVRTATSEVYRTPFPDQFVHRPESFPRKVEMLLGALYLTAAQHNFIGEDPPAKKHKLIKEPFHFSNLLDGDIKRVDYTEPHDIPETVQLPESLKKWFMVGPGHPYSFAIEMLDNFVVETIDDINELRYLQSIGYPVHDDGFADYLEEGLWEMVEAQISLCEVAERS